METVTLTDLGPIIAAVLGPVLGFVVVSMRYQHQDSVKTRDLISSSEKETRKWVTTQVEGAFNKLSAELAEHKQDTRENFKQVREDFKDVREDLKDVRVELKELNRDLGDARERLARIEVHVEAGKAPTSQDSDGQASDAA